jgi:hypothetical protein
MIYICVSLTFHFRIFKFISHTRHPNSISYEYHTSYLKTIGIYPINAHGISPALKSKFHSEPAVHTNSSTHHINVSHTLTTQYYRRPIPAIIRTFQPFSNPLIQIYNTKNPNSANKTPTSSKIYLSTFVYLYTNPFFV